MTQEYLGGELSLLLGQLQDVTTQTTLVSELALLRQTAETGRRPAMASAAIRALELVNRACWESLTEGDLVGFARQSGVSAQLWEFGLCSGLIVAGSGGRW
jgi:hypothetical protein